MSALIAAAVLIAAPLQAARSGMTAELRAISDSCANVAYRMKGAGQQSDTLAALDRQASALVARYPGAAEPLVWHAVVLGEMAKRAGILGKLSLATRARDALTRAYAIDPKSANGGAAMGLGVLFYRVPGAPFAFGDKAKAGVLLREALAIDPDGLDTNYFYGDFLKSQGDRSGAKAHVEKALKAPADPARPVWDAGRRTEARALLAKLV